MVVAKDEDSFSLQIQGEVWITKVNEQSYRNELNNTMYNLQSQEAVENYYLFTVRETAGVKEGMVLCLFFCYQAWQGKLKQNNDDETRTTQLTFLKNQMNNEQTCFETGKETSNVSKAQAKCEV